MLEKIYEELVLIRKELQDVQCSIAEKDQIEFDAFKKEVEELKTEVDSLKHKTLYLLVTLVVFVIFASFSVVNMSRQYSTIHDYYMDSQRIDQEISQSLEELIPKIEVLQSEFK